MITGIDFNKAAIYLISSAALFSTVTAVMPLFLKKRGGLNYLSTAIALSIGVYAMTDSIYRKGAASFFIDWHYAGTAIPTVTCTALVIYSRVLFSRKMIALRTLLMESLFPAVLIVSSLMLTLYGIFASEDRIAVIPPSVPIRITAGNAAFCVQFLVFLWCSFSLARAAVICYTTNPVFRRKNLSLQYFTPYSGVLSLLFLLTGGLFLFLSPVFIIMYRLVFVFSFLFQALTVVIGFTFPDIFSGPESPPSEYRRSKISSLDTGKIISEIDRIMTEEHIYYDENLSLDMLAARSGITKHQLSEILNTVVGLNFKAYVNSFRVAEAIRLMEKNPDATILSIAYRCGFNSKTTFNTLFSKQTGMKPSEYRVRKIPIPPKQRIPDRSDTA